MSTAPQRLGKYEFRQFLSKGNVGEVWKAHDLAKKRDVALKTVYPDLQRSDPQFLTRFMTDGQVLVTLRHATLVPVLEVNVTRREQSNEIVAYLAMEYIAGQTFASYLQNTSHQSNFPALSAISVFFTSLGLALDYAYERGIVHGNLTPDNILLNQQDTSHFPGGEPMLTDIGLAQILGSVINTYSKVPLYLSPEQAQGYPPSQRSDVYALGVILYEIYTGTVPFRGEGSTAIMSQHIHALPTPPALINPVVTSTLSEVILRAIAKDPIARFPNVSTFAAAIVDASAMQSALTLDERLPHTDLTASSQPVRQQNSLLGVAQPPSLSGTSQFRFAGRPSLSGLTPKEIAAYAHATPTTPAPAPLEARPMLTNPLPVEANKTAQLPRSQPSAPLRQAEHVEEQAQPLQQVELVGTGLASVREEEAQLLQQAELAGRGQAQGSVLTASVREGDAPPLQQVQLPQEPVQQLPPQTFRPVEPTKPAGPTQAISQSAISQALQNSISNAGVNAVQHANTQDQQQGLPDTVYGVLPPVAQVSQMPQAPQTPLQRQTPQIQSRPVLSEQRKRKKSSRYIVLVALLVLAIIGGTLGAVFLFPRGNTNPAVSANNNNRVFFQDGTLHNDQLRINMQNIVPPPDGKTYFAWLQDTTRRTQPLGALAVHNGSVSFLYQGDGKHTNLIATMQGVLITTEDTDKTPQRPSNHKVYQASFDPNLLDGLKSLLYATPGLPNQQGIVATLLDTLHSIDDKAGSIVDTLNKDNAQAMRQATRIIELLDNSDQARKSGDLPDKYDSQIDVKIGVLSAPSQQGYLDILDAQLKQLEPLVAQDANAQQHLTNVKSALSDLRDWLQKMHDYGVQLLQATDLQDPGVSATALQLKQISADCFTGRTIPPNASPQPTAGSAGARQAYTEAQYMAALMLRPA